MRLPSIHKKLVESLRDKDIFDKSYCDLDMMLNIRPRNCIFVFCGGPRDGAWWGEDRWEDGPDRIMFPVEEPEFELSNNLCENIKIARFHEYLIWGSMYMYNGIH